MKMTSTLKPYIGPSLIQLFGNSSEQTTGANDVWVTDSMLVLRRNKKVNALTRHLPWDIINPSTKGSYLFLRISEFVSQVNFSSKLNVDGFKRFFLPTISVPYRFVKRTKRWRNPKNIFKFENKPIDAIWNDELNPFALVVFEEWMRPPKTNEAFTFYGQRRFLSILKCWPKSMFGFIWWYDSRQNKSIRVLIAYETDLLERRQVNAILYPTTHSLNLSSLKID